MIDVIIPRVRGMSAGLADVNMQIKDKEAVKIARNISFCPATWWWGLWQLKGYTLGTIQALMELFDTDAALLANNLEFNKEDWTLETAFGRDDNFLDREEALLSSDDEEDGARTHVAMEFEGKAREELVTTLRDRDDDLKFITLRGSVASCRTNFSCSTGNSLVRSANTAKLAKDLKDNALGLAKANLDNANLAQIAKEERRNSDNLTRQIQAMEAAMESGMIYPIG